MTAREIAPADVVTRDVGDATLSDIAYRIGVEIATTEIYYSRSGRAWTARSQVELLWPARNPAVKWRLIGRARMASEREIDAFCAQDCALRGAQWMLRNSSESLMKP